MFHCCTATQENGWDNCVIDKACAPGVSAEALCHAQCNMAPLKVDSCGGVGDAVPIHAVVTQACNKCGESRSPQMLLVPPRILTKCYVSKI